jgi:hypothetical protein
MFMPDWNFSPKPYLLNISTPENADFSKISTALKSPVFKEREQEGCIEIPPGK